ncbi:hypothetical protein Syun_028298 [Stephania yunnanensis]|uniref:Uncharacterized protein n=1 Tax=Stephania yunnanensis TaxID=152371 RepID=A0AAP0HQQ2_9MAGN
MPRGSTWRSIHVAQLIGGAQIASSSGNRCRENILCVGFGKEEGGDGKQWGNAASGGRERDGPVCKGGRRELRRAQRRKEERAAYRDRTAVAKVEGGEGGDADHERTSGRGRRGPEISAVTANKQQRKPKEERNSRKSRTSGSQRVPLAWNHTSPLLLHSHPYDDRAMAKFWADYLDKKWRLVGALVWRQSAQMSLHGPREMARNAFAASMRYTLGCMYAYHYDIKQHKPTSIGYRCWVTKHFPMDNVLVSTFFTKFNKKT